MARHLIDALGLVPHPEGGYYRETYRAPLHVEVGGKVRSASTAIYFLLGAGDLSALHRIASDEVWHFYAGEDLEVLSIDPQGALTRHRVGPDPSTGAVFQCMVPAGCWFGSRLAAPSGPTAFALVGCTVAPGFDFVDFEIGVRSELQQAFPAHAAVIGEFTRS